MRRGFLGDSYDIVKQSLLRWLAAMGRWHVHPMFSESFSQRDRDAFARLLAAPILSSQILRPGTNRQAYFASARGCRGHLFLDPDTGLRLKPTGGAKAPSYLFLSDLVSIVAARAHALTLVFDQALARGQERRQLQAKLAACTAHGLHGVAYVSHACFLLVSGNAAVARRAYVTLRRESRLPEHRFLRSEPHNRRMKLTARPPWGALS